MKTLRIEHRIGLPEIKEAVISNEFMGTRLEQGAPGEVVIIAELYLRGTGEEKIEEEDLIEVKTNEAKGKVEINITEPDLGDDDFDISDRSTLTIALPPEIIVKAETENNFITAKGMNNSLDLSSENGPLKLEECSGKIKITNENGLIKLDKINGDISISEENGPISAENLSGARLEIKSENGAIKLRSCQFEDVTVRNENGMIFYESLLVDRGSIDIQNENGHVSLVLSPMQGFVLDAKAELGQIKNNFMGQDTTVFDNYNLEYGDKSMQIKLVTENGSIKINSSDMLGNDFFKGKLDFIREMLKDNSEQGIKEAHRIIGQLIASLTRLIDKVSEEAVKEKIERALAQLKAWKAKISDPEMQESVKESFENISQEVGVAVQEALKATQEALKAAKEKYKEEFKPQFDKHFDKGKEFIRHFRGFRGFSVPPVPPIPPIPPRDKEAMQDKARMKILEMLEAGKISSEEAEKLLKAIH